MQPLSRWKGAVLGMAAIMLFAHTRGFGAEEPVFSGPQVGERLPPFKAKGVFDELAGKEFDFIEQAEDKPVVLVFFHQRTRPAFGLTNTIMKYVATRSKDVQGGVIFLTDDATATAKWMHVVEKHFPQGAKYGISPDGIEGPGAYGLNRNVTLTLLVGKGGKVTANFALIQPSLQADGPKILQAIVDAAGGGKPPAIAELANPRYAGRAKAKMRPSDNDEKLTSLVRVVLNEQASEAEVEQAARKVDQYVSENESARRQLGRIAARVVDSGKLSNYGTKFAQEAIKRWAKEHGPKPER